jgi:hypothetical protein
MTNIIWIHGDCLNQNHPGLQKYPQDPAIFVWDEQLLNEGEISLKRITFIYECLLELPVTIRKGDVTTEIISFAEENQAKKVITTFSPSPRFTEICQQIQNTLPVEILDIEPFLDYNGFIDLKRFSRYWKIAKENLF